MLTLESSNKTLIGASFMYTYVQAQVCTILRRTSWKEKNKKTKKKTKTKKLLKIKSNHERETKKEKLYLLVYWWQLLFRTHTHAHSARWERIYGLAFLKGRKFKINLNIFHFAPRTLRKFYAYTMKVGNAWFLNKHTRTHTHTRTHILLRLVHHSISYYNFRKGRDPLAPLTTQT